MKVRVLDSEDRIIWERGKEAGVACRRYTSDGTQEAIINTLKNALDQAEAELRVFNDVERITDIGTTPA